MAQLDALLPKEKTEMTGTPDNMQALADAAKQYKEARRKHGS